MPIQPDDILSYWYSEQISPFWFRSTDEIDLQIRDKFYASWLQAKAGELDDWLNTAQGCLALVVILDQFPLNMFRGEARSFATEAKAIRVSKHAIEHGYDKLIDSTQLAFLYMPLMHSENMDDQDRAVSMYQNAGLDSNLRFALHHRNLIEQFGRFPHRNAILGRDNTRSEIEYLNSKSAFKG